MVMIGVHAELGVNQENFSPVQFRKDSTTQRQEWFPACCHAPWSGSRLLSLSRAPLWDAPSRGGSAWHSGTLVSAPPRGPASVAPHHPQIPPYDSDEILPLTFTGSIQFVQLQSFFLSLSLSFPLVSLPSPQKVWSCCVNMS